MTKTRYSKQRELIYKNLKARCDHPTAEIIYTELKKDNPGLSLGTVYRNLNFLADAKMIRKLDVGQTTVHFDADLSAHHHFICNECQQVYDIFYDDEVISNDAQKQTEHRIERTDLVFSGTCKKCLEN
ncbi:MAG: transcriptional repressor [Thomasclavelia sp.]|uniref:Fur family transcriptional regulator n=1 Tax=Thomasclavelia sp. TaxID=3025757 RepID=UPI00399FD8E2